MTQISILIVDEHPEVSVRLASGLARKAGFRVVAHTTNPAWAAEFARFWKPQIIITDFKRGLHPRSEMARLMKENSPDSQIVVFSSYYSHGERDEFSQAGASCCLLKGLTLSELSAELRKVAQVAAAIAADRNPQQTLSPGPRLSALRTPCAIQLSGAPGFPADRPY